MYLIDLFEQSSEIKFMQSFIHVDALWVGWARWEVVSGWYTDSRPNDTTPNDINPNNITPNDTIPNNISPNAT